MKWRKHGVVWKPGGASWWARSHATCPTPVSMADGALRVYLQCRDAENVGRIGYVDLDPDDPRRVVRESPEPVLDVGAPGAFDDNGVFQTSVLRMPDGRLFLYYVGFELCRRIRYRLFTGLAIADAGGERFERHQATPILDRSPGEEFFRCGPWVIRDGGRYRMWYVAGGSWEQIDGKAMPVYDLRHIESADAIHWPAQGEVVLRLDQEKEHGLGRPVVTMTPEGYRMHYSIRCRSPARYRLGFATSPDGLRWDRRDASIGIDVSPGAWDGESVEYGVEVRAAGRTWLLYNGDDFGATGFGIAERIEP